LKPNPPKPKPIFIAQAPQGLNRADFMLCGLIDDNYLGGRYL
jgi:hypothetical protein